MIRSIVIAASALVLLSTVAWRAQSADRWTDGEKIELRSLWIGELPPLPPDPTNRVADNPRAADFGQRLFFDTRLSANGRISCATCHLPRSEFQDGIPLAHGVGRTARRTMPIAGTAYSPFLFWDGRKDSQWAQALGPLESPAEHGGTREQYARVIADDYGSEYERVFGPLPKLAQATRDAVTLVYVNIGKAIAAYERRIQYGPSRFDAYVAALVAGGAPAHLLTSSEVAGLRLFIGKGNCTRCHNGPLLTNEEFHNTGVRTNASLAPDSDRMSGSTKVLGDEFNCRSRWSDAAANTCSDLEFLTVNASELKGAFKVPSLRNVADRPPYMHAGQMATLADVLDHYNRAPAASVGRSELVPLKLNSVELQQLEAFLRTLSGSTAAPAELPNGR